MSIFEEELISSLLEFDLEETDAILYVTLLQMGPTTVNSLSLKLDTDKSRVYRSLHKMQNLGIVSTTFSNPTICEAFNPKEALSRLIQKKSEQVIVMRKLLQKITADVGNLKKLDNPKPELSSFCIIQGRPNIYSRIGKLVRDSDGIVYIVVPHSDVLRMNYTALPEIIQTCRNNGGNVILIIDSAKEATSLENDLNVSEVRMTKIPSKGRIIVSSDSLIMSGNIADSMKFNDESDAAFYTNSRGIIDNMLRLCEHLHSCSEEIRMPSIKATQFKA